MIRRIALNTGHAGIGPPKIEMLSYWPNPEMEVKWPVMMTPGITQILNLGLIR